jgi:hypothetical protein
MTSFCSLGAYGYRLPTRRTQQHIRDLMIELKTWPQIVRLQAGAAWLFTHWSS